jgi:hypothetical protein
MKRWLQPQAHGELGRRVPRDDNHNCGERAFLSGEFLASLYHVLIITFYVFMFTSFVHGVQV